MTTATEAWTDEQLQRDVLEELRWDAPLQLGFTEDDVVGGTDRLVDAWLPGEPPTIDR